MTAGNDKPASSYASPVFGELPQWHATGNAYELTSASGRTWTLYPAGDSYVLSPGAHVISGNGGLYCALDIAGALITACEKTTGISAPKGDARS